MVDVAAPVRSKFRSRTRDRNADEGADESADSRLADKYASCLPRAEGEKGGQETRGLAGERDTEML